MKLTFSLFFLLIANLSFGQTEGIKIIGTINENLVHSDYYLNVKIDSDIRNARKNFKKEISTQLVDYQKINDSLNCGVKTILDKRFGHFQFFNSTNADKSIVLNFVRKNGTKIEKMSIYCKFDRTSLFSLLNLYVDFFEQGFFIFDKLTDCNGKKINVIQKSNVKKVI